MAIDSLVTRIGAGAAVAAAGAAPTAAAPTEGAQFAHALRATAVPLTGAHATPAAPVHEVQVAGGRTSGSGLGHQILDSLEGLHRRGGALRASAAAPVPAGAQAAMVRTAALPPGPAAAPVAAKPSEGPAAPASADFATMLRTFEHVYSHAIQVSLVSKTTGSFTSSMNKLMSSG